MTWAANFIEDAATKRVTLRRLNGSVLCEGSSNYDPPINGVHLCGQTDDGEQPTTVASYPIRPAEAKALFELARSVAECSKGEHDFCVDLVLDRDIGEDFYSNRQLWPRAIAAWNTRPTQSTSTTEKHDAAIS